MSRIISYKSQMSDNAGAGSTERISLGTIKGLIGYKIVKFDTIKSNPGLGSDLECLMKIYSVQQSTIDGNVELSDQTLLAVNYNKMGNVVTDNDDRTIIIDNVKVNQDIFITYTDVSGNQNACNYYIELEQMKLDLNEQTVATLKDIRNVGAE